MEVVSKHIPVVRIVGQGRAGGALAKGLSAAGWKVLSPLGRGDDLRDAALGIDLLVVATSDDSIAELAAQVEPVQTTVVAHLAGSLGPEVLSTHERRAAIHPLMSIPNAETDLRGAWFAVAGDELANQVVEALEGRSFTVSAEHRAGYHAAACIAANHLVALLGQVERVVSQANVPFEPFLDLAQSALDQVRAHGPANALTGPARRGDNKTLARHLEALDPSERASYEALVALAKRLANSGPGSQDKEESL